MKKLTRKNWNQAEQQVLKELEDRKSSRYRINQEPKWKEVDRQVSMESLDRYTAEDEDAWRNVLELGELTKSSEVWSADVRRLVFTQKWFDPHSDIPGELDPETGDQIKSVELQNEVDGHIRALMMQQHSDFGLKSRVDLSVKEALHHGSYVAVVQWENQLLSNEHGIEVKGAPVWVPYSMWNCYPDPSPSIVGNPFYQGSMIIIAYMPRYRVKSLKSVNKEYPFFNLDKVDERTNKNGEEDTDDVELIYRYGDLVIERAGEDIFLPNCRVILANNTIIHYRPNPMPFPEVIYNGYERLDVRDPYYVSPLIKMSPMQKIGSILSNQLLDSIEGKIKPPIAYNSNDPEFVRNGGPRLAPGSKTGHKGSADIKVLDIGDSEPALAGLQFILQQIQSGTAVGGPRTGVSSGTEQTATEVSTIQQGSELRTVDFVDKHESHGLLPFLMMQHELNKRFLDNYSYYNPEPESVDFNRMSAGDLPVRVGFDITGSKSVIGEQRRAQQMTAVTAFWKQANPGLINDPELAKQMYLDAGVKSPERFLNLNQDSKAAEMQQIVQQFQQQLKQLEDELLKREFQDEEQSLELEQKELEKEQLQTTISKLQALIAIEKASEQSVSARTEK